jgi:signal transduction histidine kinase/ActR/RegA family two-component response regulator
VEAHLKLARLRRESTAALRQIERQTAADLEAMTSLQELGTLCSRAGTDFQECLDAILCTAINLVGADKGNIQLFDAQSGALKIAAQRGFDRAFPDFFAEVAPGEAAACAVAMKSVSRVLIEDVTRSDIFNEQASLQVLINADVRAVQASPLTGSQGNLLGMILTHFANPHRFSERELRLLDLLTRQAADFLERKHAEEELAEADRRKDEFLATLAHELRNPLAPIRYSINLLQLETGEDIKSKKLYEMIERQVNQLARLVDDLMEVARITTGKIELRKEEVELAAVVRSAVETSKPLIDAGGHELSISLPNELVILNCDPIRVAQALSNLLNNAAKYTETCGQIWLTAKREGQNVVVSVRDNGIGITADMLPKVFDLFKQGDRPYGRSQGGLGIGLNLARRVAGLHGGTLEAKSAGAGKGSEFLLRLPTARGASSSLEKRRLSQGMEELRPYRILVVDDNRDSADSLGMILKSQGAEVYTANDGPTALEAIHNIGPSVVLLDIGLPGMDGYEVARRLREQEEHREVTVIALTGWGQEEDRKRSKEAGIDYHLVKPVDPRTLQALLASLQKSSPMSLTTNRADLSTSHG